MTLCSLTLDDDDVDYWQRVAEVIEPYGGRMTCFITMSEIMPSEEADLFNLSFSGHEMACHCWNHHDLTRIGESRWPHQIMDASDRIEQWTSVPVTSLAYPYGVSNERLRQYVRDSGRFLGARAVGHVVQPLSEMDRFNVPVMNRELLIGDGSETTVRINTLKYLSLCAGKQAPFMIYSHHDRELSVERIRWVADELSKEGQKFITFSDMLRTMP
jgi:peptidoglycan/xylan/chitin deacetylase (PgdA/CDA1 family)